MADVKSKSHQQFTFTLELSEEEARALNGMAAYGHKSFLEVFFEKLGKSYMQQHEQGLVSLFETIRKELPKHLRKADDARNVFRN